jgi:hypothetical protein
LVKLKLPLVARRLCRFYLHLNVRKGGEKSAAFFEVFFNTLKSFNQFMKHTMSHFAMPIMLILMLASKSFSARADERTISVNVEVTDLAVNRFIQAQTFPSPVVNILGGVYRLSITTPVVIFQTGNVSTQFTVNATTLTAGFPSYTQPVSIAIRVPQGQISVTQIIALLEGFPAYINNTGLPQALKTAIVTAYSDLQLTVYPTALLLAANSSIPPSLDLTVTDISVLSQGANSGKLTLGVGIKVVGNPPEFRCQFVNRLQGDVRYFGIRFAGNVQYTAKEIKVYLGTSGQATRTISNVLIPKGGTTQEYDIGNVSPNQLYVVVAYLESFNGLFLTRHTFNTGVGNTPYALNTWYGAELAKIIPQP